MGTGICYSYAIYSTYIIMSTSTGPTTPMMPPLPPHVDQALALLIRAVVIDTESSVLYNTRTNTSFDAEYTLRRILQKYTG